ncbi:L-threonylcarbamoyladenylate synthase [Alkanindiges sp. WGS2144]|uniref:L-threonylcarbamoyladenylate synthase n=1 Tax=Alkanindiges sp. WGS2144 TaxID=3366808 RepID=UPI003751682C
MHSLHPDQAALLLQQGSVLAYPTEAVWGLGCDPYNQAAFEQILSLKNRPIEKGVILIAASLEQVQPFLNGLTTMQIAQMQQSWDIDENQQAITWLVPLTPAVPGWISGQHDRVAIRVTTHPLVQQLCTAFGGAIVSTSANPAGQEPARSSDEIRHYFGEQLAILDGPLGKSPVPSRIMDIVSGQVLRA